MSVDEVMECIIKICRDSSVRKVYLYGSRAKGTNLERSDIDIAVSGADDFDKISEEIQDIPTLYTIDLVNLDTCGNKDLMEDIRLYGRKIYEKIS